MVLNRTNLNLEFNKWIIKKFNVQMFNLLRLILLAFEIEFFFIFAMYTLSTVQCIRKNNPNFYSYALYNLKLTDFENKLYSIKFLRSYSFLSN